MKRRRGFAIAVVMAALLALVGLAAACGDGNEGGEPEADAGTEAPSTTLGQRMETEGGSYVNVTPAELRSMLETKDFPLVNVHIPYEREIEGTDLFIPYDQVAERLGELPQERDAKLILYCRSGSMSAIAAEVLVGLGYTNVWNLDGGMIAWEQAGYPLLDGEG
jgi:rhodanese-related sulfurtransferase